MGGCSNAHNRGWFVRLVGIIAWRARVQRTTFCAHSSHDARKRREPAIALRQEDARWLNTDDGLTFMRSRDGLGLV